MHQFSAVLTDCAAMVVAEAVAVRMSKEDIGSFKNKPVYTASGAPKHVDKRRRHGPKDGRTYRPTDRPYYRVASEHLTVCYI